LILVSVRKFVMKEEIKKIVDKYGKEILLDKKKFISIFADMAPNLKKERKLLDIALSENIGETFLNCEENQQEIIKLKVRRKLENAYVASSGIDEVIDAISYALGWKFSDNIETHEKENTKQNPEQTSKSENPKDNLNNMNDNKDNNMGLVGIASAILWAIASGYMYYNDGDSAVTGAIIGVIAGLIVSLILAVIISFVMETIITIIYKFIKFDKPKVFRYVNVISLFCAYILFPLAGAIVNISNFINR